MASNKALIAIGLSVAILIVIIAYYGNKKGEQVTCRITGACADVWLDPEGDTIKAQKVCNADGSVSTPNYGPGLCKNPCQSGEVPCWDRMLGRGRCVAGASCP